MKPKLIDIIIAGHSVACCLHIVLGIVFTMTVDMKAIITINILYLRIYDMFVCVCRWDVVVFERYKCRHIAPKYAVLYFSLTVASV